LNIHTPKHSLDIEIWHPPYYNSLRKHSDPRVIPALIEALKDHEKSVRRNASKALGYKKAEEAIPALEELMNDADHYVRNDAVKAIRKIKGISSN